MLDGLLGRGFSSKCKSLINQTKSRIEVIRRKRNATLKFLKKDMADLLANGLDINAFGRAEGLLAELTLASCYDFVEQSCDFVFKHLSVMQKMRHCPEDCREAVSSIMVAAARFSDLPELRELRQTFYERYGNSLELFADKQFLENLSPKNFTMEKKVKLMEDIASEFSIRWDAKAYQQRMSKSSVSTQGQPKAYGSAIDHKYNAVNDEGHNAAKREKDDILSKQRSPNNENKVANDKDSNISRRNGPNYLSKPDVLSNGHSPVQSREESAMKRANSDTLFQQRQEATVQRHEHLMEDTLLKSVRSAGSSHRKRMESFDPEFKLRDERERSFVKRDFEETLDPKQPEITPNHGRSRSQNDGKPPLSGNNYGSNQHTPTFTKDAKEEAHHFRQHYNSNLPPPYTKPNNRTQDARDGDNPGSSATCPDGSVVHKDCSRDNRANIGHKLKKMQQEGYHVDRERQSIGLAGHENDLGNVYPDDSSGSVNPLPKPRSSRRRHSKSHSSYDDVGKVEGSREVVKRRSRSRRRDDSRRGLQILFDDEHYQNDEEDRMIDKLLLHYSKKPSTPEPGKVRRHSKNCHAQKQCTEADKSPHMSQNGPDKISGVPPSRSVSLSCEQTTQLEARKVFTRAASFQPDRSSPARHVHPKLPDYDDLAATFAALKGR